MFSAMKNRCVDRHEALTILAIITIQAALMGPNLL